MNTNSPDLDLMLKDFDKRFLMKKYINLIICFVISVMGIISVIITHKLDKEGVMIFRWMTIDGTIFTVTMSIIYIILNLVEIFGKTEVTRKSAYFTRISSAVAECLIIIVVLLSQLPCFSQHMHIVRFDMFNMHILIPLLTVVSFVLNDSPLGKLTLRQIISGSGFVCLYATVIITLITTGVITGDNIPYFFLDFEHNSIIFTIFGFIFIFGTSFFLAFILSLLNRKLYWRWFKGLGKR